MFVGAPEVRTADDDDDDCDCDCDERRVRFETSPRGGEHMNSKSRKVTL